MKIRPYRSVEQKKSNDRNMRPGKNRKSNLLLKKKKQIETCAK